ncbi:MAG: mannitol dehydrogenase family protein [Geminicoccaceae bacterium]
MSPRLTDLADLPGDIARPRYIPGDHRPGIVHLGLSAFHKAHQAVYTDDALAAAGGDWRITGVSLRNVEPSQELTPQNGLYTVIERGAAGSTARIVGAIAQALCLKTDRPAVLAALVAPETRIVSLTVTEKGYGLDRATGGIDRTHPAIIADLEHPAEPQGVAGLLVWALGQRKAAGLAPFTILCCDNLPENGSLVRGLLIDFARHAAPALTEHIDNTVAFPATMVDRITPARGPETLALAGRMIGRRDEAAVETETFRQWVIEDDFPTGRPAWEAGGAIFVKEVRAYEEMKLRMLNGSHSMLAYTGFLCGHSYVRDVMRESALGSMIQLHLAAAAVTLSPLLSVDLDVYARDLLDRFTNPHLAHETYQIAMDGTEKLPQRIFAPAVDALRAGQPIDAFAFATAAWMRYALGRQDDGAAYDLRDPRQSAISAALSDSAAPEEIVGRLVDLPGFCPSELSTCPAWNNAVASRLSSIMELGMRDAVDREISTS